MVHCNGLQSIVQQEKYHQLDYPISRKEFKAAISEMKNKKFLGLNGVTAESFKAMDKANRRKVFDFIYKFWDKTEGYDEWHES